MSVASRVSQSARTIELARFATTPHSEAAMLAGRREAIEAIRAAYPGLISATLVKLEATPQRTVWLDVGLWESEEEAKSAASTCHLIPAFAAWMLHISEEVGMEHGEVIAVV